MQNLYLEKQNLMNFYNKELITFLFSQEYLRKKRYHKFVLLKFASLCILKIHRQVELWKCVFQIALLIFTVLILSFGTSDADGNSMIAFQLSIIFPSFI